MSLRFSATIWAILLQIALPTAATAQAGDIAGSFTLASEALAAPLDPKRANYFAPRLADAAHAQHFQALDTAMAVFGTPSFPANGIETFETVCSPLNRINIGYLLFGVGSLPRTNGGAPDPSRMQQLWIANTARFQDEMSRMSAYNVKCIALHLPALTMFWNRLSEAERTPIRRNGLVTMRSGIVKVFVGAFASLGDTRIALTNRRIMAKAIDTYYAPMIDAMSLARRTELSTQLKGIKPYIPPEFATTYTKVEVAVRGTKCESLCQVE